MPNVGTGAAKVEKQKKEEQKKTPKIHLSRWMRDGDDTKIRRIISNKLLKIRLLVEGLNDGDEVNITLFNITDNKEIPETIKATVKRNTAISDAIKIDKDWIGKKLKITVKAEELFTEAYDNGAVVEVVTARIRNTYFANKVVTVAENNTTTVDFRPIDSSILGKTVYLIVETEDMQDEQLNVSFRSRENILGEGALQLMRFNPDNLQEPYIATAEDGFITVVVGNFDHLNNNQNTHNHYTNLTDHADKAIIKLQLRPNIRDAFNTWATAINNNRDERENPLPTNLEVVVRRNNEERAYFGESESEEAIADEGTFLDGENGFIVENRNFFEIYSQINGTNDNPYNFLRVEENIRRKIGYVENANSTRVVYFYYDQYGNERQIAECNRTIVMGMSNGTQIGNIPGNPPPPREAADGGVAQWNYTYRDRNNNVATIVTTGSHRNGSSARSFPNQLRIMSYTATGNNVHLIRMPDQLNINIGNNTIIGYTFSGTQRRSCNPETFAAIIGALGQYGLAGFQCTGVCFRNATCYPSATHSNGVSVDTVYDTVNRANQQNLLSAFRNWYFTEIIAGTNYPWLQNGNLYAHRLQADHNDHLHIGICITLIDNIIQ